MRSPSRDTIVNSIIRTSNDDDTTLNSYRSSSRAERRVVLSWVKASQKVDCAVTMADRGPLLALTITGCLLLLLVQAMAQGTPQQVCPEQSDISPCICTVKKNGLDILCETTDLVHITKSMGTLKGKSPIIFYLKLRHNNLPKLQGFVFLALDIRHLTIHNSSLAAIEENALSSLGECGEIYRKVLNIIVTLY